PQSPLRDRLRGGALELGQPGPRLHGPPQGGLLPARSARHLGRPPLRDGADAGTAGDPLRVPPPRGRVGRPVRARPPLPDANPYTRPYPCYETPVILGYSHRNRSACIRIPMDSQSPKANRIQFRCPHAAANPYLAFSAMLMAGLDGIEKGLDAGEPADWDLFD